MFSAFLQKKNLGNGSKKPIRSFSLGEKLEYVAKYQEIKAKNPYMTDEEIAKQLDISRTNLDSWKRGNFGKRM